MNCRAFFAALFLILFCGQPTAFADGDPAVTVTILDSWSNSSTNAEKFAFVPGLVKNWLNLDFEALTPVFNMRLQPLLRDTLNALIENGVNALNPSQTQYLIAVSNILENVLAYLESMFDLS